LEIAVAVFAGTLISLFIHEAGHAVAACAEGLTPGHVRLLGFLGVIPYIMLRIPGLYTIRPAGRLRVWIAGPFASLSLASFCYLASGYEALPLIARIWLDQMTLANVMVAVWNCCPLLPTDGYFIVSTLLRQANWRIRSWRELSNCVRYRRRPRAVLFLYALGSSAALAILAVRSIGRILKFTNFAWFGYAAVLLLLLFFGYKRAALKRRRIAAQGGGF
jgi:Zn-dependent protease